MSTRLLNWVNALREEMTDIEISAGLGNGDIAAPDYLSYSESNEAMKIWDNETNESAYMGFLTL